MTDKHEGKAREVLPACKECGVAYTRNSRYYTIRDGQALCVRCWEGAPKITPHEARVAEIEDAALLPKARVAMALAYASELAEALGSAFETCAGIVADRARQLREGAGYCEDEESVATIYDESRQLDDAAAAIRAAKDTKDKP